MSVLGLLITIVIVGAVLYLVNAIVPMDAKVKTILNVVVVVLLCLWLLDVFVGVGPHLGTLGRRF
jgi:hypothetical protein